MRWTVRIGFLALVAWAIFVVSPFLALYRLAGAVKAQDVAEIRERVDFRALRLSLSKQILSEYLRTVGRGQELDAVDRNLATSAGATVGEVFRAGTSAYEASGFAPEEWRLHHQGGPTGYEPRDYLATAASAALVEDREAFAWNPSVPSLKSEDTVLASPTGPDILTVDPAWPTTRVDGLERPLVLEV